MNTFPSSKALIIASWHQYKKHWKFIILAGLATVAIQIVLQMVQNSAGYGGAGIAFLATIFIGLIGIIITLGWTQVLLQLIRKDLATWDDFKTKSSVWVRFIKAMLWYIGYFIAFGFLAVVPFGVIIIIGLFTSLKFILVIGTALAGIAFALVAIYFAIRYQFITYTVLDYPDLSGRDIFKKSGAFTKGHMGDLLVFGIALGLLNILGAICLLIGLAITIPVTKLAKTRMYEHLKHHHAHSVPEVTA